VVVWAACRSHLQQHSDSLAVYSTLPPVPASHWERTLRQQVQSISRVKPLVSVVGRYWYNLLLLLHLHLLIRLVPKTCDDDG